MYKYFAVLASQVRCYCILYLLTSLLQCIGQNFCMNFTNSHVLVYYIKGHFFFFFFVLITGCHNCSYSAILYSFLYFQIQLYDTFSLSPLCALDIVL